nr:MRL5 glyoxalase-like domain [Aspergillus sp.]
MSAIPPAGTPVGLEIPAKDVARGSAFYQAVFNWTFAPSSMGLPAHKLLTFSVPGGVLPIGGAMRLVEDIPAGNGATKLYLYVEDVGAAMEAIEKNGGKKAGEVLHEGDKGLFQYFVDSEGNNFAIYSYK